MFRLKSQSGFTLIEVIIVLAITGLLIPLVFAGQHQQLSRNRFSEAVEKAKTFMIAAKNESQYSNNEAGSGNDTHQAVYGNMLTFVEGSNAFRSDPITYDQTTNKPWSGTLGVPETGSGINCLKTSGGQDYKLAWSTVYASISGSTGAPSQVLRVLFRRNPETGVLESFIQYIGHNYPCVDTSDTGKWHKTDGKTNSMDHIDFTDPDGHKAFISIDSTNQALVTATYDVW